MSLVINKSKEQNNMNSTMSTMTDIGLDLFEILQFGQIAMGVGVLIIILRGMLL